MSTSENKFKQFTTTQYNVYTAQDCTYFIHSSILNIYFSNSEKRKSTADLENTDEFMTIKKLVPNIKEAQLAAYFPTHLGNISSSSNKHDLTQIYKYIKLLKLMKCQIINDDGEEIPNCTDVIIDRDNTVIIKSPLMDANLLKYVCYNKRFNNKVTCKQGTFDNNDIKFTKMNLKVVYETEKYKLNPDAVPLIYYPHGVKQYIKENIKFNENYLNSLGSLIDDWEFMKHEDNNENEMECEGDNEIKDNSENENEDFKDEENEMKTEKNEMETEMEYIQQPSESDDSKSESDDSDNEPSISMSSSHSRKPKSKKVKKIKKPIIINPQPTKSMLIPLMSLILTILIIGLAALIYINIH